MLDMIEAHGHEEPERRGGPRRWHIFDDPFGDGRDAVFGLDEPLARLVRVIRGGADGERARATVDHVELELEASFSGRHLALVLEAKLAQEGVRVHVGGRETRVRVDGELDGALPDRVAAEPPAHARAAPNEQPFALQHLAQVALAHGAARQPRLRQAREGPSREARGVEGMPALARGALLLPRPLRRVQDEVVAERILAHGAAVHIVFIFRLKFEKPKNEFHSRRVRRFGRVLQNQN